MKGIKISWVIGIAISMMVGVAVIFIASSGNEMRSPGIVVNANQPAIVRKLILEDSWTAWWPKQDKKDTTINPLKLNGFAFTTGVKQFDAVEIIISEEDVSASTLMSFIPLSSDSTLINWNIDLPDSSAISNVQMPDKTRHQLIKSMYEILANLKLYVEKKENLYGFYIQETTIKYTSLLVIKTTEKTKPGVDKIYANINTIRNYVKKKGAKETNHPMLNISFNEVLNNYELMVAIAVNKRLEGNDLIVPKRMVAGKTLYTEVLGGERKIQEYLKQMENYVFDHQRTSSAQSYQLLVTDRQEVTDTTKWVTRIYYPII